MNHIKSFRSTFTIIMALAVVAGISGITPPKVKNVPKAEAANFSFQTGYYGADSTTSVPVTGVGFSPDLVMAKANSANGWGFWWKTSNMPADTTAYLIGRANDTSTVTTLDSDGFTVTSSTINSTGTTAWYYAAFDGSQCDANGTFCVGSYTGTGVAQNITSVGFQPTLVWVKAPAAYEGIFKTDAMDSTESCSFVVNTCNTTDITGFLSNGFSVGTTNPVNRGSSSPTYYYVAFKDVTGMFNAGTYTTNNPATDGLSITGFGVGYTPQMVVVKKVAATAATAVASFVDNYGDLSVSFTDADSISDRIQSLVDNGFTIGTDATVQTVSSKYYWFGFGGAPALPAGSGTFQMYNGTYTGNSSGSTTQAISGVGFKPDLVICRSTATGASGWFKTRFHISAATTGTASALGGNTADTTSIINTLDSNGFTLGTSTNCNNNGSTYHYQAFRNAYTQNSRSGAADFAMGVYIGTAVDNTNITRTGIAPDMVVVKASPDALGAVWNTTSVGGDNSQFFDNTAQAANDIQSLSGTDGFQIGSANPVNISARVRFWFAFKKGSNFSEGTYTGNGTNDTSINISNIKTQPDLVWVKQTGAVNGVFRPSTIANGTDSTLYFSASAAAANRIDQWNAIAPGFRVDNNTEVNTSSTTYYYAAWRIPVYTPSQSNWRFFDAEDDTDANLDTTTGSDTAVGDAIAAEDTAPTSTRIMYLGNKVKLRVKVGETEGKAGTDVKYKLQYDTSASFTAPGEFQENNTPGSPFMYDTDNTDGYTDDEVLGVHTGGGTQGYCKLSGMGGDGCGDTGSYRRGRVIEDATTGLGQGSQLDPVASTTYEHEFVFELSTLTSPTANTTYYFRLCFMTNSAGSGVAGPWTVVPLAGGASTISFTTAAAYDLEVSTAPAEVNMGVTNGASSIQYVFTSGEKIGFWDKRGGVTAYNVVIGQTALMKLPDPPIRGTSITWTSATGALYGAFATSKTNMTTSSPFDEGSGGNAYSASPSGLGGFYFQPTIDVADLAGIATGVYTSDPAISITII